jgi:hypothetical protein
LDSLQFQINVEEAFVKALQSTLYFLIPLLTAVHLQKVACCLQCLTDAGEIGARDFFGDCEGGQMMRMDCVLAGLMEFALQVLLQGFFGKAWFLRPVFPVGFWIILLIPQFYMVALTVNYFDMRVRRGEWPSRPELSAPIRAEST